jgi:hypothetical protein
MGITVHYGEDASDYVLIKISYIGTLFVVQFIQDFDLFKVWFRHVSLYSENKYKLDKFKIKS